MTYYSVSGNTRKICEYVGKELGIPVKELYDVSKLDDFVILGFPVHCAQPPRFVKKKIRSLDLKGKKFFIIISYGLPYAGKIMATLAYLTIKRIIEKGGGTVVGKFICPGGHTIIKFLNKGRPNERDLKEALEALRNCPYLSH